MTATRRLAAILAIDVVGYSRRDARGRRGRCANVPQTVRPDDQRCGARVRAGISQLRRLNHDPR
jgi:hypothetical protein